MEFIIGGIVLLGLISVIFGDGDGGNHSSNNNHISHKGNSDDLRVKQIDLEAHWARKDQDNNRH